MSKPKPHVIDFETAAIAPRPEYPPIPAGFSLKSPGDRKSKYYAWGHPTNNNCTKKDAEAVLRRVWTSGEPMLFHNAKFDVDVAQEHMGLMNVPINLVDIHDTMLILFLLDPHAWNLGLKPSAQKHLGMEPEEQDVLCAWLLEHQTELRSEGLIDDKRITKGNFGAYIAKAPGNLVGEYANGDVLRTLKLFEKLWPEVHAAGMIPAYQREQKLMPILLKNEREGMRGDVGALKHDLPLYQQAMKNVEIWLRKRLKTPDLDFEKDVDVGDALDKCGVVTEWTYTPKSGQRSLNKKNLKPNHYKDQKVFSALGYRNKLGTCLNTYMLPWLETMDKTGGLLHAGWQQTRNDKDAGTRTGRLSSSPNFMAVAKSFEDKGDGWTHPEFIPDLPHLPLIRTYILPDKPSHLWGRRDYNQQELRILAHFEDGKLLQAYRDDPRLDVHGFVQAAILDILGIELPRTPVKTLNFGLIYGQGVGSMAEKLNREVSAITAMRNAQFQALPGLKELDKAIKARGKSGEPITTWGGRQYYCEEPRMIENRWRTFEYKLLNYLIQGSAADCSKEALIRYDDIDHQDARFTVMVHDEINISSHKKTFKKEMLKLREVMMSVEFDLPMVSDAEFGPNWADMTKLVEPAF